jgi:hypothetical protein
MTEADGSKRCPTCCAVDEQLPAEAFFRNPSRSDGLSSQCRTCHHGVQRRYYDRNVESERARTRRRKLRVRSENRERVLQFLRAHPCIDCGERDPVVLEFHHVRDKKRDNVACMLRGTHEWGTIATEIAKCVVLCANCHRRRTAVARGDYRARHSTSQFEPERGGSVGDSIQEPSRTVVGWGSI